MRTVRIKKIVTTIFFLALAALVIVLYFTHVISGILAIVLLIFAGIFILTSLFSFCLYIFLLGSAPEARNRKSINKYRFLNEILLSV